MSRATPMSDVRVFPSVAAMEGAIGEELGPSDWLLIRQADINAFADTTKDWQRIHVDSDFAAQTEFRSTIAHGYFLLSLLSYFARQIYRIEGTDIIINYGIDTLRFITPVRVDMRIRAAATVTDVEAKQAHTLIRVRYRVNVEHTVKPALVATTIVAIPHD